MPLYDLRSARPSHDARRTERKRMKLAVPVGDIRHSRLHEIPPRHLPQRADRVASLRSSIREHIEAATFRLEDALTSLGSTFPADFQQVLHASISAGIGRRIRALPTGLGSDFLQPFLLK